MTEIELDKAKIKLNQMSDENLIYEATKNNNQVALDCLIDRYKDMVNIKANKFFMVGSEKEDILQEGYIGLYKAVKSYNLDKQNSFKTFAGLCIERQMITAVKNSNRQKHIPLNSSVSLNAEAYQEDGDTQVIDILDTRKSGEDPLEIISDKEYYNVVEKEITESLSGYEKQVLSHFRNGESYAQIATNLKSKIKSVDTAIQRIRKKALKIKQKLETD